MSTNYNNYNYNNSNDYTNDYTNYDNYNTPSNMGCMLFVSAELGPRQWMCRSRIYARRM